MNVTAVIAEYNPFHNGHRYHLERAAKLTGADYTVVAMSGDFTQRGMPALADKHLRTRMALLGGADLVLELPVRFAAGSAEYFADGAVALLDALGVADHLVFGSECGDISLLVQTAALLEQEPAAYQNTLREALKQGFSFPAARSLALSRLTKVDAAGSCPPLSTPNDILGVEYCRALLRRKSAIRPHALKRAGADYHSLSLPVPGEASGFREADFASAAAIRKALSDTEHILSLQKQLPDDVFRLLSEAYGRSCPIWPGDFSSVLHYRLLSLQSRGYQDFLDVTRELSDKISKHLDHFTDWEDFCLLLKSRELTYTRISRALLHILLDIRKPDGKGAQDDASNTRNRAPYARILGFRQSAAPLLHSIKKNTGIPLISKLADAGALTGQVKNEWDAARPSSLSARMLEEDIFAAHIYQSVVSHKFNVPFQNEYRRPILVL